MDLANAALLIAAVLGLSSLVKSAIFGSQKERLIIICVVGVGLAATFLVGATSWAHEQVIGDVQMAKMSVADKFLIAVFAAGAASAAWETLGAIKSIGYNQPKSAVRPPIGVIQEQPPTGDLPMPEFTGDDSEYDFFPNG